MGTIMKKALFISCFDWYKTRIEPMYQLLIKENYQIKVLIADFDHIKKERIVEKYKECTYINVPKYKKNISVQRIKSHLVFGRKVKEELLSFNPNLIYCQIPPNNVGNICYKYKKANPDIKLILDIIDLWPESMPIGGIKKTLPANIWKSWRDKAISVADHVFTECSFYQNELENVINKSKTSTLYLYKEQNKKEKELIRLLIENSKKDDIIRFAYLGSMNNIIDIDGICKVLQHFIDGGMKCQLHAIGDGESRNKFEEAVSELECDSFFYGCVFDEIEKIRILVPCDYALNMMKDSVSVGLTIKSIDYLSYGLPIINNIKGDTWEIVEKERIGWNTGTKETEVNRKDVISYFSENFEKRAFVREVKNVLVSLEVI